MELIESGLAGMELFSTGSESSASMKKSIRKQQPRRPPRIHKTEEQRGGVAEETARPTEEQEVEETSPTEEQEVEDDEETTPPTEEQQVENYRKYWERCFGRRFGSYEAETSLGSMYCATGTIPPDALPESSLQFFSIKVTDLEYDLTWPLQVHGFVAARDSVDRKRNYLFRCSRDSCQILTEKDPYLRLTGPSRAVLMIDPVAVEVQLKLKKGKEESEDKVLAFDCFIIRETYPLRDGIHMRIPRRCCTLEFALAVLGMSVETTVGVRLVDGSWPDQCSGLIVCNIDKVKDERMVFFGKGDVAPASASKWRMVLLDFKDGKLPTKSENSEVELSRHIVSVNYPEGKLIVSVEASRDGFSAQDSVEFGMKLSGTSTSMCDIFFCKMEVTVTWSLVSMYRE